MKALLIIRLQFLTFQQFRAPAHICRLQTQFVAQRDTVKPAQYTASLPLNEQLLRFMDAELYLVNDPMRRKLSRLLTNTFLLDTRFGQWVYGQYAPHQALIQWLEDAQKDRRYACRFLRLPRGCSMVWDVSPGRRCSATAPACSGQKDCGKKS